MLLVVLGSIISVEGQQQPLPKRFPGVQWGNPSAPIFLQEFADYQCPDCAQAYPTVEKVLAYYGPDKVFIAFILYCSSSFCI